MKIVIDATPLLLQSAGVKGHLYHWIRATRAAADPDTICTWPAISDLGQLDHSRSQASRLDTWLGLGAFLAAHRLELPAYDWLLPMADVFHACILQTRLPRKRRVTATVFDVTPLTVVSCMPLSPATSRRTIGRRCVIPLSRNSRCIFTIDSVTL